MIVDTTIRKLSIAESAQHAAQLAADTLVHQDNPHEPGSVDHAEWAASYTRAFNELMSDGEGSC